MSEGCVYVIDQGRFVPQPIAAGPWDPGAQHGGAPSALLAREVERVEAPVAMQVVRMTVEIMRPVPMVPLEVRTRAVRTGKRIQLVEAAVLADDTEVVRAAALRIRRADAVLDATVGPDDPVPPLPEESWGGFEGNSRRIFSAAMEMRFAKGEFGPPGPATVWFRLKVPVVAGEPPSPLQRVMAAADFGNGVSSEISWFDYLFINPDLTVYLHREPVGEWVCLDAVSRAEPHGVGLAESALYDERGRIGRSLQSLFVDRR